MFGNSLRKCSLKRPGSAQPLIDNDAQRVLITGWARMSLNLLRCHIPNRTCRIQRTLTASTLSYNSNAKIAEQDLIASPQQYIFWLDVPVDQLLIMGIL